MAADRWTPPEHLRHTVTRAPDDSRLLVLRGPRGSVLTAGLTQAEALQIAAALIDAAGDPWQLHHQGCWRDHRHAACARVRAGALDEVATVLAAAGYRHDQGHGPSYPPEPGEVPGIVRDVLGRLARAEARAKRLTVIVRELAVSRPDCMGDGPGCDHCGADTHEPHDDDCRWRLAREVMGLGCSACGATMADVWGGGMCGRCGEHVRAHDKEADRA